MTLIAALQGKTGIALAADSRGTIGDPRGLTAVNDLQDKLFKLSDRCGICISGAAELAAKFIDELKADLQASPASCVDVLASRIRNKIRTNYNDWFAQFDVNKRPNVNLIVAGYNDANYPRIYLFSSSLDFAPQLCTSGFMLAGIPQYATYLVHRLYNNRMTLQDLTRLAAYLITETATQDPKVGGPIKIATVTKKGKFKMLSDVKVQRIIDYNKEQNRKLRESFFKGGSKL